MYKGMVALTAVPLRAEPLSRSEILSFMLFGERYTCLEFDENAPWIQVKTDHDAYTGFISADQHSAMISPNFEHNALILDPLLQVEKPGYPPFLCAGSEVNAADFSPQNCVPMPQNFSIKPLPVKELLDYATRFLGVAYLWGGRSAMGMDCSGLIQILFKVFGVALPRDSSQQHRALPQINPNERLPGDLVFFAAQPHSRQVMHVGLYMGDEQVLHASGKVKIDRLTQQGILKPDGTYSHFTVSYARCKEA